MNRITHKFLNDIIRPWVELNLLLCKRNVLEPEISRITKESGNIATNINHIIDYMIKKEKIYGIKSATDEEIRKEKYKLHLLNKDFKIICDLADSLKHIELRNKSRICFLYSNSCFEVRNREFRFVRHKLYIKYQESKEQFDFMEISIKTIDFLIKQYNLKIDIDKNILENSHEFYDAAWLISHDEIYVKSPILEIVKKNKNGSYEKIDYEDITYIVFDENIMNLKNIKEIVSNQVKLIKSSF